MNNQNIAQAFAILQEIKTMARFNLGKFGKNHFSFSRMYLKFTNQRPNNPSSIRAVVKKIRSPQQLIAYSEDELLD